MFKNHIKIAWRNLFKNKSYFFINTLGLSVALTVSFLMLLWVYDEYSIDKFHSNEDRLFLGKRTIPLADDVFDVYDNISYPMMEAAIDQIPEIEKYGVIGRSYEDNLKLDNKDFRVQGAFTNADFFSSFSFPILMGDITALDKKPEALAISERLANRFWGSEWKNKAIGSSVKILDNGDFTVEAVYKDFPKHSSIQNDFYYGLNRYIIDNQWMLKWGNNGVQGVFLLSKEADVTQVSDKLNTLFQDNIRGDDGNEKIEGCFLHRFSDNYLYNKFDKNAQISGGRIDYVRLFMIAAIFLLVISCINFVNLSTAYATKRASEIGVRKVVGAGKKTLVWQFLIETSLITFIAFSLAILLTLLLLPSVGSFVGKNLEIDFTLPQVWISILAVFTFTTLLSGAYPSLVISSFRPIAALKGQAHEKKNNISLRKALVVFQFGLAILLVVAAIVVKLQINYINEKDLGVAKDNIVSVHQDKELTGKYEVIRTELMSSDAITDVTLVGPSPLEMNGSTSNVVWPGKKIDQQNIEFSLLWTAHNFPDIFDIPLNQGTYYREGSKDTLNIVLNERAIEIMGLEDPIGKTIQLWREPRQIIGVLKDFHNQSLYEPIQPAVFLLDPENAGMMFIKMKSGKTKEAISALEKVYANILPDIPLHFNFLEEEFAAQYKSETLTGSLAYYFALISILISCLGLFGLATFMAKQRTKEIVIRKVLGASVRNITTLISKDFLKLVLLAFLITSPIAYYIMDDWLQDFAYKIKISWWVFLLTGSIALLITLLTIGFQSIKAAMANPVKSLRTE